MIPDHAFRIMHSGGTLLSLLTQVVDPTNIGAFFTQFQARYATAVVLVRGRQDHLDQRPVVPATTRWSSRWPVAACMGGTGCGHGDRRRRRGGAC